MGAAKQIESTAGAAVLRESFPSTLQQVPERVPKQTVLGNSTCAIAFKPKIQSVIHDIWRKS